jgi:hypothetical protein
MCSGEWTVNDQYIETKEKIGDVQLSNPNKIYTMNSFGAKSKYKNHII